MNLIVFFDILAVLGFGAALLIAVRIKKKILDLPAKLFLCFMLGVYIVVCLSNILEHGAITDYFDLYEDYLEILFLPFFLFFVFSVLARQDLVKRKRAEEALKNAHDELELRVQERTLELSEANELLRIETSERKLAVEEAAVMEERSRLARELHDSVTQTLYSLTLFAETGHQHLMSGDNELLDKCLQELGLNAKTALKEMRLLLYDLRPLALEEDGLFAALQKRLETVEQRAGVTSQLIVEGSGDLSPQMESGLYRIAQEALNNSLKHSRATSVTVKIRFEPEMVELEVSDNGVGFDRVETDEGGLGLSNIRERSEKLGGALHVESSPDNGTNIRVRIKRIQDE